jgi:hypothetical protein
LISDLTYIVVAHSEIQPFDTNICIDWAVEMMMLGYETPSLLMLSSFNKSQKYYTSYFEIIDYLNHSISELGLDLKKDENGILSYASYYINKIARQEDIRENLCTVSEIYDINDFGKPIYDFRLLYWAWDQLDYDEVYNHYWEEATASNIEQIVLEVAQNWIKKYEKDYKIDI